MEEKVAPVALSALMSLPCENHISTAKPSSSIRCTRSSNGRSRNTISAQTASGNSWLIVFQPSSSVELDLHFAGSSGPHLLHNRRQLFDADAMGYKGREVFGVLLQEADRIRENHLPDKSADERQLVAGNVLLGEIRLGRTKPEQDYATGFLTTCIATGSWEPTASITTSAP